ncbi:hypothetical protein llap_3413 [Limosa lapponica baueri]|uniref:Uncharacterized protein n=1 Tax=Limosa lapponica baueri TaxID=1758121 RepID=A0A2I0UJS6_LIMLA|nr:hypothetical protein llap_3413 [Limosa lapponica baueri]
MYCTVMAKVSPYSYQYQEVAINKLPVDAPNHGKARRGTTAMPHNLKSELRQLVHVHLEKKHSSYKDKIKKVAERRWCDGGYIKENPAENDKDDEKD